MPNILTVNVSGGNVCLSQAGVKMTHLPPGFCGEIPLTGIYNATLVGTASTVPEYNYGSPYPSSASFLDKTGYNGTFYVGTNHEPITLMTQLLPGTPLFYMRWNNDIYYPAGTVPKGVANYNVTASLGELGAIVYSDTNSTFKDAISTNMVTTNAASVDLGSFESSVAIKSITFHPNKISTDTYATEFQAVTTGFVLGLTVLVFAFILRLVRAIPSQGGDF